MEGEILASQNVVLEPLETRLSFPVRKPQTEPRTGKEKEKNEKRAITIYPENTKTLSSRALSMLSSSAPFVPARNASPLLLAGRTRVEARKENIVSLCKTTDRNEIKTLRFDFH
ncbi:hypothetical protein V8G54_019238 [Vigna mungo]|uniref:Uncharacterized protein n=1 Tax=Vigna mungo TaxID=3915 RepID=A0AAQ3NA31_VIGMU